jgi:hypothetical protein
MHKIGQSIGANVEDVTRENLTSKASLSTSTYGTVRVFPSNVTSSGSIAEELYA